MKLIFLFGMPGVGKLTVARELSRLTGFKVFHNHLTVDLAASLFEFGSEPFISLRERIWFESFSQAIRAGLEGLIFTFTPERSVPADFPERVENLVTKNGGKIIFVELKCSSEELENRLAESSRRQYGKLNSVEFFRQLLGEGVFEYPPILPDLAVETTNLSAFATAQVIAERL